MKYLLLIYSAESKNPNYGEPEFDAMLKAFEQLTQKMEKDGVFLGGEGLEDVVNASCVRKRNQKIEVTDGPFAETKEQLGGYYLIECENLDQALQYAAEIPIAEWGSVEVRPVAEFS